MADRIKDKHSSVDSRALPPAEFDYKVKRGRLGFFVTGVYKNVAFRERLPVVEIEEARKLAQQIKASIDAAQH